MSVLSSVPIVISYDDDIKYNIQNKFPELKQLRNLSDSGTYRHVTKIIEKM